jgi:23S rRNA (adenine-N6)-dimethyltransferase
VAASGRSRREWGWHRLADEWAARVVAEAGVRPGELVLDIGAGHGALTAHPVRARARVVAVELNPQRADATRIPLPGRPFRVVANPPYGITTLLLRKLLAPGTRLSAADVVLQRAAARKCAATSHQRFTLGLGLALPRRAFLPPPHVDSQVLVIRRI